MGTDGVDEAFVRGDVEAVDVDGVVPFLRNKLKGCCFTAAGWSDKCDEPVRGDSEA